MAPSTAGYNAVLTTFMSWKDNEDYWGYQFSPNKLTDITSQHVLDWFNFRAYKTVTPSENDQPITHSCPIKHSLLLEEGIISIHAYSDDAVGRSDFKRQSNTLTGFERHDKACAKV